MSKKESTSSRNLYRVEWSSLAIGKTIASSKHRLVWKFGFANQAAVEKGLTGPDCRGEEHEIVVVYSLTSGKRLVTFNNREVFYTTGISIQEGKFQHSWTIHDGHTVTISAYFSQPHGKRQYDMFVDGLSFFKMPQIFELGTRMGEIKIKRMMVMATDEECTGSSARVQAAEETEEHKTKVNKEETSPAEAQVSAAEVPKEVDLLLDLVQDPVSPAVIEQSFPLIPKTNMMSPSYYDGHINSIVPVNLLQNSYGQSNEGHFIQSVANNWNTSNHYGYEWNTYATPNGNFNNSRQQQFDYAPKSPEPYDGNLVNQFVQYELSPQPQPSKYFSPVSPTSAVTNFTPELNLGTPSNNYIVEKSFTSPIIGLGVQSQVEADVEANVTSEESEVQRTVKRIVNLDDILAPVVTPEKRNLNSKQMRPISTPAMSNAIGSNSWGNSTASKTNDLNPISIPDLSHSFIPTLDTVHMMGTNTLAHPTRNNANLNAGISQHTPYQQMHQINAVIGQQASCQQTHQWYY